MERSLLVNEHCHLMHAVALSLFRLGDWSDDSPLWAQYGELREAASEEKRRKRHGVFWMPFDSFVNYFECVDICKIRPDWYELRDSGNFYPDHRMIQAYRLTVTTLTELDVTLHRRISKNLRIQRSEVSLCVAIVNMEEQENGNARIYSIPILSQRGQHKFVSTDGSLQPGTYLLLPCLFNPINKQMDNTQFNIGQFTSHTDTCPTDESLSLSLSSRSCTQFSCPRSSASDACGKDPTRIPDQTLSILW